MDYENSLFGNITVVENHGQYERDRPSIPTATPVSLDEVEPSYLKLRILGRGNEKSIEELADALHAASYPEVTRRALLEMQRQGGTARPADDGLIYRGLMIRHLVMPDDVNGTERVMEWIASELPGDTYVNIMTQYTPRFQTFEFPRIARRVTSEENGRVVDRDRELGLTQLDLASVNRLSGG